MAERFEIWTPPWLGTFARKFPLRGVVDWSLRDTGSGGPGWFTLEPNHPHLAEIVETDETDHTNDVVSILRLFDGATHLQDWVCLRREDEYTDEGDRVVKVHVDGMAQALADVIAIAFDYDANPTVQPDHIYGGPSISALKNGDIETFEDENWGAELGDTTNWAPTSASGDFRAPTSFEVSTAEVRTGTYAFACDPSTRHSGFKRTVPCTPGERLTITAYLKEPTAAGKRYTMAVSLGAGAVLHSTGYIYNNYALTELDNVAPIAGHTGLPGGSSDGTWQSFSCDVTMGTDQESFDLVFQYDHHDGSNGPIFYVDDVDTGVGSAGLDPWEPVGDLATWERDTVAPLTGTASIKWATNSGTDDADGFRQTVKVEAGKTYTFTMDAYHADASSHSIRAVAQRVGGPWITSNPVTVAPSTVTPVAVTFTVPDGLEEIQVGLRYSETGTSPTLWADNAVLSEGLPAATVGKIWGDLLDDAGTDHAPGRAELTWLNPTFTDALDSAGNAWDDSALAIRIRLGQTYAQVAAVIAKWGYEHRIWWSGSQFDFDVFNPGGGGTDHSANDGPAVLNRDGLERVGPLVKRRAPYNWAYVVGKGGLWTAAENSDLSGAVGRVERFFGSRDILDSTALTSFATDRLAEAAATTDGLKLRVAQPNVKPWRDYRPFDTITVTLSESWRPKRARRCRSITYQGGEPPVFEVDFTSEVFTGPSAQAEAVSRLLKAYKALEDELEPEAGTGEVGDHSHPKESLPTVFVASSTAREEERQMADFKCDGDDDHEEINAAIGLAAGGRVVLSSGEFNVSVVGGFGIDFTETNGGVLQGMGQRQTVIRNQDNDGGADELLRVGANTTVRDIGFVIDASAATVYGIRIAGHGVRIENCYISTNGYGIVGGNYDRTIITGNRFAPTAAYSAIYLSVCDFSRIVDNVIVTTAAVYGAISYGGQGCIISGNTIYGGVLGILDVLGSDFCTIANNEIELNGLSSEDSGIQITAGAGGLVIVGNQIRGYYASNIGAGIEVGQSQQVIISDNVVDGFWDYGIQTNTVTNGLQILGNHITSVAYGIDIIGGDEAIIANNYLTDLVYYGVKTGTDNCTVTSNRMTCANVTDPNDGIQVLGNYALIADNFIDGFQHGVDVSGLVEKPRITNNQVFNCSGYGIYTTGDYAMIAGNSVDSAGLHGIYANGVTETLIANNHILKASATTDDTSDGIYLAGTGARNMITGNLIRHGAGSNRMRYAINIAAATLTETVVVGNDLRDACRQEPIADSGTDTLFTWPNHERFGDNYVDWIMLAASVAAAASSGSGDLTVTP